MRVQVRNDGSIRFMGDAQNFDVVAPDRAIVLSSPGRPARHVPFDRVHQISLVGRPGALLALNLALLGGEVLELGHLADPKLGQDLARKLAKLIGCPFGGILRMATSFVGEQFDGPTTWMDLISSIESGPSKTAELASMSRTQEVAADDIMGTWPKDPIDGDEATDATVMEVVVEGAKTVEVPKLRAPSHLMDDFDSACAALLDAHDSISGRR